MRGSNANTWNFSPDSSMTFLLSLRFFQNRFIKFMADTCRRNRHGQSIKENNIPILLKWLKNVPKNNKTGWKIVSN